MSTAFSAGYSAFREAYTSTDIPTAEAFGTTAARRLRYDLLWATYENTVYRDIHRWAPKMRADLGLYRYTRAIHSPAYRVGEFYAAHVWGGELDPEAGDGKGRPSAIPIVTENEALRPACAALWRASNFAQRKAIAPRWGSVYGDVGLIVRDDPARRQVMVVPVQPYALRDVVRDSMGHVKAYVYEEERPDPRRPNPRLQARPAEEKVPLVKYTEIATRDGDDVVYQTFLDDAPWDWTGDGSSEWRVGYGFVPLVVIPHLDVGMEWGWSELHAGLPKFREVDDLASKLHDQIRKTVDPVWMFAGVAQPASTPSTRQGAATSTNPQPGRDDLPALYGPVGADAKALVADIDIGAVAARIDRLVAELGRDYPEIDDAIWDVSSAASGAARRAARARVEVRALERRAGYDAGLVRAMQMAIAIGGEQGYPGYEGFGLGSYDAGTLDFSIGPRPVFPPDPTDAEEIRLAFWTGIKMARDAGAPLAVALRDAGWSDERIAEAEAAVEAARPAMTPQPTGQAPRADMTDTPTAGGNTPEEMMTNE